VQILWCFPEPWGRFWGHMELFNYCFVIIGINRAF
jgi:hypothetical protein